MNASSLEDLIGGGRDRVAQWLESVRTGQVTAPSDINWWLGLVYVATLEAKREAAEEGTTAWGRLAVDLHDDAAKRFAPKGSLPFEERRAYLRIALVQQLGVQVGDPLLDPAAVVAWVVDGLPEIGPDVDAQLEWRTLPSDRVLALRRIRQRLMVAEQLGTVVQFDGGRLLSEWLALKPRLP